MKEIRMRHSWIGQSGHDTATDVAPPRSESRLNGPGSKVRLQVRSETMWDRFWGAHQKSRGLHHRIIWFMRHRLSRSHAEILIQYSGNDHYWTDTTFRILEVGCGSAMTTKYLAETAQYARGFGVDLSQAALKIAREQNSDLVCVVADALALPFQAGSFSLTFSSGVVEHFDRCTALKMQGEHCRVTKSGGSIGIIVPEKNTPYDLLRRLSGSLWPFGSELPFSRAELAEFAAKELLAGLVVKASLWITLTVVGVKVGATYPSPISPTSLTLNEFARPEAIEI